MRVVIELKRGEVAEIVLNNLYAQTPMETVFGINMVALQDGQPKLMSLREMLEAFMRHRREVVTRRTIYELRQGARTRPHPRGTRGRARQHRRGDRAHQGGAVPGRSAQRAARARLAAGRRDRNCWSAPARSPRARRALAPEFGLKADGYHLSEAQAQAILDMRLHRLTGLEQDKIIEEYQELLERSRDCRDILGPPASGSSQVVRAELLEMREAYGDARRTEINRDHLDLTTEDLIEPQDVVVTLSHAGYAKSQPVTEYQTQRRGGRGKTATAVKDEDFVEKLFVAHTHDTVLCFSNRGKVYWLKVFELPQAGRGSRGKPMVNLLPLEEGEKINALLPVKQFDEQHFVFMATRGGTVKKTPLAAFSRPRSSGIIAVDLRGQRPTRRGGAYRR